MIRIKIYKILDKLRSRFILGDCGSNSHHHAVLFFGIFLCFQVTLLENETNKKWCLGICIPSMKIREGDLRPSNFHRNIATKYLFDELK